MKEGVGWWISVVNWHPADRPAVSTMDRGRAAAEHRAQISGDGALLFHLEPTHKTGPWVRTWWRRGRGEAAWRWWTEARLLIHFIIYIKTNSFSCARSTDLLHTNLLIEKYIKQLTANYVQIPLNRGVREHACIRTHTHTHTHTHTFNPYTHVAQTDTHTHTHLLTTHTHTDTLTHTETCTHKHSQRKTHIHTYNTHKKHMQTHARTHTTHTYM